MSRPLRDRPAFPVPDQLKTRRSRRRGRVFATVAAASLAAAGVVAAGVPASATPGTAGYQEAFRTDINATVTDVAVDSYSGQTFAAHSGGVSILDESSGVIGNIPLPGATSPLLDADQPYSLVWALDAGQHTLSRIDERTNTVTGSVTIPGDLRDLAVDHTTRKVFVTTGTTGTVVPVDENTLALGTAVPVGGTATRIGVDAASGVLYVVDAAAPSVVVVAEATSTVTATVAVPASTVAITVDSAHHKAYLGSAAVATVTAVDGTAGTASSITVPNATAPGTTALGIDPTTQTVIGQNGGQIFRVDTTTGVASTWNDQGGLVTTPDIAVDVFTNTVIYGAGTSVLGHWEPVSFLGTVSGLVSAGAPYSQQIYGWTSAQGASLSYAVTAGALPAGLTLTGDTISGTATTPGIYTFGLTATIAGFGDSVTQTYSLHVVSVDRTAGGDRFATSVEVSKAAYPDPTKVGTVYVANGISFPDALSGGPAAAKGSGPLLLTAPGYLPASVSAEITRLHPQKIVVVGGATVVSDDVVTALKALAPSVTRESGADRFATSRQLIRDTFTSAPTVYVSTGLNFPDSLSAGGAAGSLNAPLLLVNGGATSVDADTASLLQSLGTTKIVVIGGNAVMSPSLVADFGRFGTVEHLAGADRFESSELIVESAFHSSSRAILANGLNFPDALGASAWSGKTASPLFITLGGCVPERTLDDIFFQGASAVTLVGGTAVLAPEVAGLTSCGGFIPIAPAYPATAALVAKKADASTGGPVSSDHRPDPSVPVNPLTHGAAGH